MGGDRVLVTDLDGTLLGDDAALDRFRMWVAANRAEHRLIYASGRHVASIREIVRGEALPSPDAVISSVGTEIHDPEGHPWPGWLERFAGWHAERARLVLSPLRWLDLQPEAHQTWLKASYTARGLGREDLALIRRMLVDAGIVPTIVYSSGIDLDILPGAAGKGRAARFVTDGWGVSARDVLAFGDSGNDAELLRVGYRGTMVGNALPELDRLAAPDVYRSPAAFADGVLDGIRHWSGRAEMAPAVATSRSS
jgi:sucrose-6F-phosphate phosphohydrolase